MLSNRTQATIVISLLVAAFGPSAGAQIVPWVTFTDTPISASVCDVVNAANAELVVLADTGELVIVTGRDVILQDTFVDANDDVFFQGQPAGFLTFADDGDGFRTLWWVWPTGRAVRWDDIAGAPAVSDAFPDEFPDVPCDACDFWDDPVVCPPRFTPNICGLGGVSAMVLTALGLSVMGLTRRRWG
jgi:hypothetical protein